MESQPYRRMQQAAWAAFRREPDDDGIRRVPILTDGAYQRPYFCLTESGHWFLEDRADAPGVPATPPRSCPVDWVPPEFRADRNDP